VKTAAMVNQSVGYDAGKKIKGRKRFINVDTLGLVLLVFVNAASQTERDRGKVVPQRLKEKDKRIARLHIRFGLMDLIPFTPFSNSILARFYPFSIASMMRLTPQRF
jgi:hypothetical protein